jgi:hypothetical protein
MTAKGRLGEFLLQCEDLGYSPFGGVAPDRRRAFASGYLEQVSNRQLAQLPQQLEKIGWSAIFLDFFST